jgi:hypothetical protein
LTKLFFAAPASFFSAALDSHTWAAVAAGAAESFSHFFTKLFLAAPANFFSAALASHVAAADAAGAWYPSGDPLLSLTNAHAKRGSCRHKLLSMTSKHTVLDREMFVQALRHMGEQDLLFLNRMVVERLNLLAQARSTVQLAQFAVGDRVEFTANDGSIKRATVLRLNKKTTSLLTDDAQNWNVSPAMLRKLTAAC